MVNSSVEDANFPIPSITPEIIYRSEEERALNGVDLTLRPSISLRSISSQYVPLARRRHVTSDFSERYFQDSHPAIKRHLLHPTQLMDWIEEVAHVIWVF